MKDSQKIYIKGNQERGDEVIKLLEKLGGYNSYSLDGHNSNNYYFIAPDETINNININVSSLVLSFVKTFYKEIELQEWKPEYREIYYFIDSDGIIVEAVWYDKRFDKSRYEFGNCFRTLKEAEIARDKFKELLNNKA